VDAVTPRRVIRRRHHPALVGIAADDHRLVAKARTIPLFDGGVERIHVDVQDHLSRFSLRE
jgi:hypothetical protein